jgi:hypothetical protein
LQDLINCPNCGEEVTTDSDFCPHCGIIFSEAEQVLCDEHTQKPATGVCIICRRVFCEECGVKVSGRRFCLLHKKVKVQQDWAEVFRSTEISDSELVKSVLESTGHKVQVQNFRSIGFAWEGGGDSAVSRSNMNNPAKVFVPIPEYLDAIKEIAEWKSLGTDVNFDEAEYE